LALLRQLDLSCLNFSESRGCKLALLEAERLVLLNAFVDCYLAINEMKKNPAALWNAVREVYTNHGKKLSLDILIALLSKPLLDIAPTTTSSSLVS
jgi:hypothetical protein